MPDKIATLAVPEGEAEDTELAEIASLSAFDEPSYRRMLIERGFSEAEADAAVAPMRQQAEVNRKLFARQQRGELASYRFKMFEEFSLPPTTPLAGTNKAELRRSAQQFRAFADSIAASLSKTTTTTAAPDERAAEWGAPPSAAAEVVRETPDRTWEQSRRNSVSGPAAQIEKIKQDAIDDIKAHGPREIQRASIGKIMSRQSQAARAAEAAKA